MSLAGFAYILLSTLPAHRNKFKKVKADPPFNFAYLCNMALFLGVQDTCNLSHGLELR